MSRTGGGGDAFSAVTALFGLLALGLWLAGEGLRCLGGLWRSSER